MRVSKYDQNQDLQFDAMKAEGCEKIFHEKISGAAKNRPEFERMQEQLRPGDGVVVYDIDRLGCTTVELILLVDARNERGIGFKSASRRTDVAFRPGRADVTAANMPQTICVN